MNRFTVDNLIVAHTQIRQADEAGTTYTDIQCLTWGVLITLRRFFIQRIIINNQVSRKTACYAK